MRKRTIIEVEARSSWKGKWAKIQSIQTHTQGGDILEYCVRVRKPVSLPELNENGRAKRENQ